MTLLTARDIRETAAEIGLRPTKQKGQNFVIDPNTVRSIVTAAGLEEASNVVEIGPGLGSLTLGLLEAGHSVTAVEIDEVLATKLPSTVTKFAGGDAPFQLVNADALKVTELPAPNDSNAADGRAAADGPDALVANLPYNVAVPVLLHFLETFPNLQTVLVMVQLEVAERLAADPGSRTYGVPSVKAQWYGDVQLAGKIGKNVFWPAPNIDSGLVRIDVTRTDRDPVHRHRLFTLIDAAFAQRRKTLRAALSGWAGSPQRAEELLTAAGIDPKTRGEALTVADFERLAAEDPSP
ncbi:MULTISPECIES: 16S rRNA (adenine(1518)-N(6)/adenine(1519)-N(6))-dimethyltransferase RsmA [unclassified Brevibacterium]|uniref:16S rRNA (adenine(1518)-N(6)/adenine(1519)-N(6))- dimethyltransferase RsmA n=1 Tax=unclassified Brevibacterium TaxID=2614124 RepID=UPI0010925E57|nr:16S rRNA (adenine(1518)-N(6)/adenine(1519)-N(6))-dimethyltransferase RsmA [Brevibacterium sp. S22]TGD30097.1 16S rRNA (adenine(1518)-N(6)/adenine(1519)-N(6))-dimethyltransferase RsmA [Brevibacterium sp. S22]